MAEGAMVAEGLRVRLVEAGPGFRPYVGNVCVLCGEYFDGGGIDMVLEDGSHVCGLVCHDCLVAGVAGAAGRMRGRAKLLRLEADRFDVLAGELSGVQGWPDADEFAEQCALIWAERLRGVVPDDDEVPF